MSEQELDVQELDEFKASGEDSELPEPTNVKAKKRIADKDQGEKTAQSVEGEKGGDLIAAASSGKKAPARKGDKTVGEHVDDIFAGEELSEEFKEKAAVIFETVVNEKVNSELSRLEEEFTSKLDEQVQTVTEDLEKKLDSYMDYVVEEWMKDNKLAVDRGLRADVAESFIGGLKVLFSEHNISMPEEQVDVVAEMAEKIEELEKKLNEQIDASIELSKKLEEADKEDILEQVSKDLADTQAEKLRELTAKLEYADLEDFQRKVGIVKENYFSKTEVTEKQDDLDTVENQDETQYVDPNVARYAQSITKTFRNF